MENVYDIYTKAYALYIDRANRAAIRGDEKERCRWIGKAARVWDIVVKRYLAASK